MKLLNHPISEYIVNESSIKDQFIFPISKHKFILRFTHEKVFNTGGKLGTNCDSSSLGEKVAIEPKIIMG